ncbi:hypothetical protein PR048_002720 [Dryococelus australis]|uniref:Uncharacterized protein n=1 Tax=Dryococelus australis TaxID=614101 RepID=A0ABQ9IL41_9NEOP|nr:hypothetical protein PR048_002720 [Dryococelus australis]
MITATFRGVFHFPIKVEVTGITEDHLDMIGTLESRHTEQRHMITEMYGKNIFCVYIGEIGILEEVRIGNVGSTKNAFFLDEEDHGERNSPDFRSEPSSLRSQINEQERINTQQRNNDSQGEITPEQQLQRRRDINQETRNRELERNTPPRRSQHTAQGESIQYRERSYFGNQAPLDPRVPMFTPSSPSRQNKNGNANGSHIFDPKKLPAPPKLTEAPLNTPEDWKKEPADFARKKLIFAAEHRRIYAKESRKTSLDIGKLALLGRSEVYAEVSSATQYAVHRPVRRLTRVWSAQQQDCHQQPPSLIVASAERSFSRLKKSGFDRTWERNVSQDWPFSTSIEIYRLLTVKTSCLKLRNKIADDDRWALLAIPPNFEAAQRVLVLQEGH